MDSGLPPLGGRQIAFGIRRRLLFGKHPLDLDRPGRFVATLALQELKSKVNPIHASMVLPRSMYRLRRGCDRLHGAG